MAKVAKEIKLPDRLSATTEAAADRTSNGSLVKGLKITIHFTSSSKPRKQ
jgi:hypothetical protein